MHLIAGKYGTTLLRACLYFWMYIDKALDILSKEFRLLMSRIICLDSQDMKL